MENFTIQENVPVIDHRVERSVGHVAALGRRLAVRAGHEAILMYAQAFDDFNGTNHREELLERFAA